MDNHIDSLRGLYGDHVLRLLIAALATVMASYAVLTAVTGGNPWFAAGFILLGVYGIGSGCYTYIRFYDQPLTRTRAAFILSFFTGVYTIFVTKLLVVNLLAFADASAGGSIGIGAGILTMLTLYLAGYNALTD